MRNGVRARSDGRRRFFPLFQSNGETSAPFCAESSPGNRTIYQKEAIKGPASKRGGGSSSHIQILNFLGVPWAWATLNVGGH